MTRNSILHAALLAFSLLVASSSQAATEILDQVVAIVDDDIIMASELRERLAAITESLKSREVELPPEDTLIRETLDRLILESIQIQKGTRVGVRISDAQLDGAMQRIAAQNQMTPEQFQFALDQQGKSYAEMREQVRREMILQRVQSGNVNQRIQITEQEVNNFLATEDGEKLTQPEYSIVHALLPLTRDASASEVEQARKQVNESFQKILEGAPFDMAISSTTGPLTYSGGDLGWRKLDDLPSLFSDIAPTLEAGETAEPFRSDSGFHLVHMQSRRGGELMVDQTRVRHILIKPSEILSDEQARAQISELKSRIEAGEDFTELAKEYSEDIGSAQEGGDLGWTTAGQMVPEFDEAMAATASGSLSEPVRSQFGWHLLEVQERRRHDMSREAAQSKAMDYLHNRKYQEELNAWLQQIRDEAFVDIK